MAISKITLNGVVQIDLTQDTVTSASDFVDGKKGHLRDGTTATGSLVVNRYYTGTSTPSSSLGNNGDLYLVTS